MRNYPRKADLIRALCPGVGFVLTGDDITYWDSVLPQPSAADLAGAVDSLRRLELHTARRKARTEAETGGFHFNGHPFDSDRDSILRITNAATAALAATLAGGAFHTVWRCQDDYEMPLDAAGVMGLQSALSAHGQACHDRSSALRTLIEEPDTDLDALAEEIKTGWPGGRLSHSPGADVAGGD